MSRPDARCYADRKSLFTLSNSFDNRVVWPPAAPGIISRPGARYYADRKSLFTLSNSFDHRGVLIWPPAAPSLTFAIAKSFFGALCNTSAIIGLS